MASRSNRSVFKRILKIKDEEIRTELGRAHLLVALLAFALFMTLAMVLQPNFIPDKVLSTIAMVMLVVIGFFSLTVAVRLAVLKK